MHNSKLIILEYYDTVVLTFCFLSTAALDVIVFKYEWQSWDQYQY